MIDEELFLAVIHEHLDEWGPRLVFADWLEEQGDPRALKYRTQLPVLLEYAEASFEVEPGESGDDRWRWQGIVGLQWKPRWFRVGRAGTSWLTEQLTVNFRDDPVADELWLVVARYTTGCTFGSTTGNVAYIGAYTSQNEARNNAAMIGPDRGRDHNGRQPWVGYFEELEGVEVYRLPLLRGV